MFLRTVARRGTSAYAVFLRQTKTMFPFAAFKGTKNQRIAARGKATYKAYTALSPAEKAKLVAIAKKTTFKPRARKVSQWRKFVKANFNKVQGPLTQRFSKLAKLYKAKKHA